MVFHVFLLVVGLFLSLALLWHLDCLPLQPSSSPGEIKRSRFKRLLKPRCPDDCPACRLVPTASSGVKLGFAPVRPWSEVKSRRGATKRISCIGYLAHPSKKWH